jgi:hypothetical protein
VSNDWVCIWLIEERILTLEYVSEWWLRDPLFNQSYTNSIITHWRTPELRSSLQSIIYKLNHHSLTYSRVKILSSINHIWREDLNSGVRQWVMIEFVYDWLKRGSLLWSTSVSNDWVCIELRSSLQSIIYKLNHHSLTYSRVKILSSINHIQTQSLLTVVLQS